MRAPSGCSSRRCCSRASESPQDPDSFPSSKHRAEVAISSDADSCACTPGGPAQNRPSAGASAADRAGDRATEHAVRLRGDGADRRGPAPDLAELHAIEADIRGSPPERRLAERHARAAPLVETFGDWLKEQRARVSPKARLGELHSAHPHFRVSSTSPTSANAAAESSTSWRSRMACLRIAIAGG